MVTKGLLHADAPVDLDDRIMELLVSVRRKFRPSATLEQAFRQNVGLKNLDLAPNRDSRLGENVLINAVAFLSHNPTLERNVEVWPTIW